MEALEFRLAGLVDESLGAQEGETREQSLHGALVGSRLDGRNDLPGGSRLAFLLHFALQYQPPARPADVDSLDGGGVEVENLPLAEIVQGLLEGRYFEGGNAVDAPLHGQVALATHRRLVPQHKLVSPPLRLEGDSNRGLVIQPILDQGRWILEGTLAGQAGELRGKRVDLGAIGQKIQRLADLPAPRVSLEAGLPPVLQ